MLIRGGCLQYSMLSTYKLFDHLLPHILNSKSLFSIDITNKKEPFALTSSTKNYTYILSFCVCVCVGGGGGVNGVGEHLLRPDIY